MPFRRCTSVVFPDTKMIDLLYIAGTVLFFALCIAYIGFCEKLGGNIAEVEKV